MPVAIMKRGNTEMNVKSLNFQVKQLGEPEERVLSFIGSNDTPDRDNDSISVEGWDISNYEKNPVFLWGHDYSIPPLGKAIRVYQEKGNLLFDVQFPEKGIYPLADLVYNLYKGGFLNATSVGFIGKEAIVRDDESVKDLPEWKRGVKFLKQELLELSAVPVPANPTAIQQAKSVGAVSEDEYTSLMSFINGEFVTQTNMGVKTINGIKSVYEQQTTKSVKEENKVGAENELKEPTKVEPETGTATKVEGEPEQTSSETQVHEPEFKLLHDQIEGKTYLVDSKTGSVISDLTEQVKTLVNANVIKSTVPGSITEKAGATISKQNKSRLSQAKDLIMEVLGEVESEVTEETSKETEKDPAILSQEEELNKPSDLEMNGKEKSATPDEGTSTEDIPGAEDATIEIESEDDFVIELEDAE